MSYQLVPVQTIGQICMVSDRYVHELTKEGILPKHDTNKYDLIPTVQAYIRHLKKQRDKEKSGADNSDKARLTKAKADIAEMEAEQLAGQLVEVSKVEKSWTEILARVKPKLLSVAPKAAPIVAVESTVDSCSSIIQKFVDEALSELNSIPVKAEREESDGEEK